MLAVSLKWRLGVVRRRPKGTKQERGAGQTPLPAQGLGGWTWVWMEGEAGERRGYLPLGPLLPALSVSPCFASTLSLLVILGFFFGFESLSESVHVSCFSLPQLLSPTAFSISLWFSQSFSFSFSLSISISLSV